MTLLAMGEALVEFLRISDENTPQDSTSSSNRPIYRQGFGGDTSNAIIAATRQGASTGYITAVGGDPLGQELMQLWESEGVDTTSVRQHATDPTGAYFVQPHASGRSFSYARRGSAASHYKETHLPLDVIGSAEALHTSALTMAISDSMRDAVFKACKHAKAHNTLVSFDTNLRLNLWDLDTARAAIEKLLPHVDIVFPSDDEAAQLCDSDNEQDAINYFKQFDPQIIVLTKGAEGAVIHTADAVFNVAAKPAKAVDSTGAGDSFAGSFLAHYLETENIEHAANCAATTAAIAVSGFGAIDPLPDRETVLSRLPASR